jgi:hypothetical protein
MPGMAAPTGEKAPWGKESPNGLLPFLKHKLDAEGDLEFLVNILYLKMIIYFLRIKLKSLANKKWFYFNWVRGKCQTLPKNNIK